MHEILLFWSHQSGIQLLLTSKIFKAMHNIRSCLIQPSFYASIPLDTTMLLWYLSKTLSRLLNTKLNVELLSWCPNANLRDVILKIMNSFLIWRSRQTTNCSLGYVLEWFANQKSIDISVKGTWPSELKFWLQDSVCSLYVCIVNGSKGKH